MPRGQYDRSKVKRKPVKRYNIGGKMMSIWEISRQPWCNVPAQTIWYRMNKCGMGLVEAVTTGRYETIKAYEYKGKMRSLAYLSRLPECVVEYQTLWYRLKVLRLPVEWALETPPNGRGKGSTIAWKRKKAELQPIEVLIEEEERRYG